MPTLHAPEYRVAIVRRIGSLSAGAERRWGRMSAAQMLWHLNEALAVALGKTLAPAHKTPLPGSVMKFLILNFPWPRNAPTLPSFVPSATATHDFEYERRRLLTLLDEFAQKDIAGAWPVNPVFGRVSGREVSRLQAKHVNHHLTQFGV